MGEDNKDYIRKHVDTIILRTLLESDSYGYDILKEIDTKSNGLYSIKQPTLYNSLKRLEKIGYISSYEGDISNGGKRRYYSLTDLGRKVLDKETEEWEFSRTLMSRLLSDKDYDLNNPPPYNPSELRPMTKRNVVTDNPASTNYVAPQINPVTYYNNTSVAKDNSLNPVEIVKEALANPPFGAVKPVEKVIIDKPSEINAFNSSSFIDRIYKNERKDVIVDKSIVNNVKDTAEYKNSKGYQLLYGEKDINEIKNDAVVVPVVNVIPRQITLSEAIETKVESIIPEKPIQKSYVYSNTMPSYQDEEAKRLARQRLGLIPSDNAVNTPSKETIRTEIVRKTVEEPKVIEGLQFNSVQTKKSRREVGPIEPRGLTEAEVFTNNVQYRPALDELFRNSKPNNEEIMPQQNNNSVNSINLASGYSFNSLKSKFKTEGYKLRPYNKSNTTSYYLSNFIYNNQINRDCFTIMYLLIVTQIIGIFFFADTLIKLGLTTYLTVCAGLILIPISFWIVYAVNPNKRIKAKFNLKISLLTSMMVFLNLLVVITLAGFFIFKADITNISTMILPIIVPSLLIFNIPLSSIIYAVLYNTKQYHLR